MSTDPETLIEEATPPESDPILSEAVGLDALSDEDFPGSADDVNAGHNANGDPIPDAPPAADPTIAQDPATPVDPVTPAEPSAPPVPAGPSFDQQVAALGIQGVTPENAGQMLLQQHQTNLQHQQQMQGQYGAAMQMAQDHQALLQNPAYRQFQEQQQAAPVEEAPAQPFENPYPEPSPAQLQRYTESDGEGGIRWKADSVTGMPLAPAKFREDTESYAMHKQNLEQRLRDNPYEVLEEAIEHRVPDMLENAMNARQQKMNDEYYTEKIMSDNQDWMVGMNPRTGQQDWTPQGNFYGQEMYRLRHDHGMNVQEAHEFAFAKTLQTFQPQQQQPPQQQFEQPPAQMQQPPQTQQQVPLTPAEQAEAMKRQHLAAGGNILTDRSGPENPPGQDPLSASDLDIGGFLDGAGDGFIDYLASQH